MNACNSSAASRSRNQMTSPCLGLILLAGQSRASSRIAWIMAAFAFPVTRKSAARALLSTGNVWVTLQVFNSRAHTATAFRPGSRGRGAPGKSDAVCPSVPTPRRIRSKTGGSEVWKNLRRSFSYSAAACSTCNSHRIRWIWAEGMDSFDSKRSDARRKLLSRFSGGTQRSSVQKK